MGRPPKFSADAMLDVAADLLREDGPRALTASAVASRLAAPSGSIYHRFPSRDHLAAGLWLRTLERFDAEVVAGLVAPGDPAEVVAATAVAVVRWCAAHPREAHILAGGRLEDLLSGAMPADLADRAAALRRRQHAATREVAERLGRPVDLVALAVAGIPVAAVRPYLSPPMPIPEWVPDGVDRAVRALLRQETETT